MEQTKKLAVKDILLLDVAAFISAIIIVGIYIIGTIYLNTLFLDNDSNIVAGIMQAIKATAINLNIPWLVPLMAIFIAVGALVQINSWLIGPIYMLNVATANNDCR